jgi:hypothetical protein
MEKQVKKSYSAAVVVAMAMAFGASTAGVNQDRIPELQRESWPDAKRITLTGCVTRATPAAAYTLTNITKEGEVTPNDTMKGMTVLLGGADVDLSKHVGHRVALTGSYASDEAGAIGTKGTHKPAADDATSAGDKKMTGTFTVKSLKMVSESCSQPAE